MNPGDLISRYRIVGRIGRGGMGVVYRAEDTRLRRPVALKFLPQESISEPAKARFLNEARAAALAHHPNICPIHDIEQSDGELFIVMAFLEGETLARRVARGRLPPVEAIRIAGQVAAGLAAAHQLGIVHRDIKTANIMLGPDGHVSIMDFGLALAPEALRMTAEGASVGTPHYMSPEQALGREVDARTDVWSLGVVLFEMLTGVLPFRREHRAALIHAILTDPAPPMSSSHPGISVELESVVAKTLAKDPAERWPSASALLSALNRLDRASVSESFDASTVTQLIPGTAAAAAPGASHPTHSDPIQSKPVPSNPTPSPPSRDRKGAVAAVSAAALLLTFAAAWTRLHFRSAPAPAPAVEQVAVLPFEGPDSVRPIADGLDEVLTAALSNEAGLIATPSSDLRRRGINTVEGARKFYGATVVITGAALPLGDKVQFTLNRIDAARGTQVGGATFVYDPKKAVASRDEAIAHVLRLMHRERAAPARDVPSDAPAGDAYSAYLEGRGLLARYDVPGNIDRAITVLTRATEQDPRYALAVWTLAEAYRLKWYRGDAEAARLALENAERAVQLEPGLAAAHSVLGRVYRDAGRRDDAVRELERAMELAPNNADAPRELAEIYKSTGRYAEAEALYQRANRARPTDWNGHMLLGLFYYTRERYAEAEAELNRAKELAPDNDLVRQMLGGVYVLHGRYQQAIDEYQQALRIRSAAATYAGLAGAYYLQHRFGDAISAVEAATDLNPTDYRFWGNLGIYAKWAPGNEAKAKPALQKAVELATALGKTRKSDFNLSANLAEYYARLGDPKAALAQLDRIPETARGPLAARFAVVYALTGRRDQAVAVIRANLKSPDSLHQIEDDPDLGPLWRAANH